MTSHCTNLLPNAFATVMDADFKGGCGSMEFIADVCPGIALVQMALPQVGPHATASCLVELTSRGQFVDTERYSFDLYQWFMSDPTTGGYMYPARTPESRWFTLSADPTIFAHDFD